MLLLTVKSVKCPKICMIERNQLKNLHSIWQKMSVVPQGVFAARKVRLNEEKLKNYSDGPSLAPTKYSSKYMNSIWGMYNRYSVHNLKKNLDFFAFPNQKEIGEKIQPN